MLFKSNIYIKYFFKMPQFEFFSFLNQVAFLAFFLMLLYIIVIKIYLKNYYMRLGLYNKLNFFFKETYNQLIKSSTIYINILKKSL